MNAFSPTLSAAKPAMPTRSPSGRFLAVRFPRLPVDRLRRMQARTGSRDAPPRTPQSGEESAAPVEPPLVVVEKIRGSHVVASLDEAASRAGVSAGMTLSTARAIHPGLAVMEADPAADARTLETLADWAERYTPFVGLDGADGLLLEVTGSAHLFGG